MVKNVINKAELYGLPMQRSHTIDSLNSCWRNMKKLIIFFYLCSAITIIFSSTAIAIDIDQNYYKIGSADVLEIITWKEKDFTREVFVRMDGKITFPLLDDIHAAGRTTMQIKKEIETKLKEFIENPVVTINVKNPLSQKFYILGEVVNTGEYQLVKKLTILQAFALAGGFTEWASKNEIILLRNEDGIDKIIRVNYKNIIKGKNLSQNVNIKVNDTIIVP